MGLEDRFKLWDEVTIEWIDSCCTASSWFPYKDMDWEKDRLALQCVTMGVVVHIGDDCVSLAASVQGPWEDGHPNNIQHVMCIPLCVIERVTVHGNKGAS